MHLFSHRLCAYISISSGWFIYRGRYTVWTSIGRLNILVTYR